MTDLTPCNRPGHVASAATPSDHTEGMSYLESLPRRLVTLYLPLFIILVVLLFPFYWMALTSIKPDEQLIDMDNLQPVLGGPSDLQAHPASCCSKPSIRAGSGTRCMSRSARRPLDRRQRAGCLCHRAAALQGRAVSSACLIFFAYLVPPSILFIPLAIGDPGLWAVRLAAVADPGLSDAADPVLDLAVDGILQDHPLRATRSAH